MLNCLLDGEKRVALRLKLATGTVRYYAKQIYKHFGGSSRAELAYFLRRYRPRPSDEQS